MTPQPLPPGLRRRSCPPPEAIQRMMVRKAVSKADLKYCLNSRKAPNNLKADFRKFLARGLTPADIVVRTNIPMSRVLAIIEQL